MMPNLALEENHRAACRPIFILCSVSVFPSTEWTDIVKNRLDW